MKVRVVKESGAFRVQIKRKYWPFWVNKWSFVYESNAINSAKDLANPDSSVIWSSDSPEVEPCK